MTHCTTREPLTCPYLTPLSVYRFCFRQAPDATSSATPQHPQSTSGVHTNPTFQSVTNPLLPHPPRSSADMNIEQAIDLTNVHGQCVIQWETSFVRTVSHAEHWLTMKDSAHLMVDICKKSLFYHNLLKHFWDGPGSAILRCKYSRA